MKFDIFISHSSNDKKVADKILTELKKNNISCWISSENILPGKDWLDAIIRGINSCKIMVVVLSSSSNNSKHVQREVRIADSKGITTIPFKIEDMDRSGLYEYYLDSIQMIDASGSTKKKHFEHLIESILVLLDQNVNNDTSLNFKKNSLPQLDKKQFFKIQ